MESVSWDALGDAAGGHGVQVLLAVAHPMLRRALEALLAEQADLNVAAIAANCQECCHRASTDTRFDVVVCDTKLGEPCEAEGLNALRDCSPALSVVALDQEDEDLCLMGAVRAGVQGFLTSNASPEEILRAIRVVSGGGSYVETALHSRLMRILSKNADANPEWHGLSPREIDILQLVAEGRSNQLIADGLEISRSTVKYYMSAIFKKLGAANRAEAVRIATERHLVTRRR